MAVKPYLGGVTDPECSEIDVCIGEKETSLLVDGCLFNAIGSNLFYDGRDGLVATIGPTGDVVICSAEVYNNLCPGTLPAATKDIDSKKQEYPINGASLLDARHTGAEAAFSKKWIPK